MLARLAGIEPATNGLEVASNLTVPLIYQGS